MHLPDEKVSHRGARNIKALAQKKESFLNDVPMVLSRWPRDNGGVDMSKIWAVKVALLESVKACDLNSDNRENGDPSTQGISSSILNSHLVLQYKCVGLDIFYPSRVPGI